MIALKLIEIVILVRILCQFVVSSRLKLVEALDVSQRSYLLRSPLLYGSVGPRLVLNDNIAIHLVENLWTRKVIRQSEFLKSILVVPLKIIIDVLFIFSVGLFPVLQEIGSGGISAQVACGFALIQLVA